MSGPVQIVPQHWCSRLPFYYGWMIVGIAFVTMAIGVTAQHRALAICSRASPS